MAPSASSGPWASRWSRGDGIEPPTVTKSLELLQADQPSSIRPLPVDRRGTAAAIVFPYMLNLLTLPLLALASVSAPAGLPTLPPSELHPGDHAVVRTVFQGDSVESFDAEI